MLNKIMKIVRIFIVIIFLTLVIGIVVYNEHYTKVYQSIEVKTDEVNVVEYGMANYDVKELVTTDKDSEIVSVEKDIDTLKVGVQTLVIKVMKDNVYKDVEVNVEVKDTVFPVIELENQEVSVFKGEEYDLQSNVKSVNDTIDGDLEYSDTEEKYSYTIETDYDKDVTGNYEVKVVATDKSGNKSEEVYNISVVDREIRNRIVNLAMNYVGYPYAYGGNSPAGFDCSGFVQYVYGQQGISISRSATTQINDGYGVPYSEALPGDILSWGYADGTVTHSALYIGDGKMIHAANPSMGVLVSDVAGWQRGSNVVVLAVRRVI